MREPELLAFAVVIDFAQLGTLLLVAAAEAVCKSGRFSVVCVISGDVTAMAAFVRLHTASTVDCASVTACTLFSAPVYAQQQNTTGLPVMIYKIYKHVVSI